MIAHTGVTVRNYTKGKKFYQKALAPLGYKMTMDFPKWKAAGFKEGGHTSFWIGQRSRFAPSHVAFLARSKAAVQRFHRAARAAGAKDNGEHGFRPDYGPTYYAAFVLDADGNNIEACYFGERAPRARKAPKAKRGAKRASKKRRA